MIYFKWQIIIRSTTFLTFSSSGIIFLNFLSKSCLSIHWCIWHTITLLYFDCYYKLVLIVVELFSLNVFRSICSGNQKTSVARKLSSVALISVRYDKLYVILIECRNFQLLSHALQLKINNISTALYNSLLFILI